MKGMPSCREVAEAIASDRLQDSPPSRRFGVWLHLLMCRHCRRYARQMRAIGAAAREVLGDPAADRESVARLRRAILGRLER
jgi:hypothetical protein